MTANFEVSPKEYTDLATHVDLCSLRYSYTKDKLDMIEKKIEKIELRLEEVDDTLVELKVSNKQGTASIIIAIITSAASIIAAIIGALVIFK